MATAAQCPPDLVSIAGGKEQPVRGDLLWTRSRNPSKLLVEKSSIANLTVASPGSDLDDSTSEISTSSTEDGSDSDFSVDLSSEDEELVAAPYPPSPPIKTVTLPISIDSASLSSASSSDDEDYFSIRSSSKKTFLDDVFPRSKVVSKAFQVPTVSKNWDLALLQDNSLTVLYCKGMEALNLRENLVDLLDRADEEFEADQVVVVLDKRDSNLATILHSLMYVGGVVIPRVSTSIHRKHSSQCILVGIEL